MLIDLPTKNSINCNSFALDIDLVKIIVVDDSYLNFFTQLDNDNADIKILYGTPEEAEKAYRIVLNKIDCL